MPAFSATLEITKSALINLVINAKMTKMELGLKSALVCLLLFIPICSADPGPKPKAK